MLKFFKTNKKKNRIDFHEQMQEKTFCKNNIVVGAAGIGKTKFFTEPRILDAIYKGEDIIYMDRNFDFIELFFYKLISSDYKITIINKVSNINSRDFFENKIIDFSNWLNSSYLKRNNKNNFVKLIRLYKDLLDYKNLVFIEEGNKEINIDSNEKNFVFILSPYPNFNKNDQEVKAEITCIKNIISSSVEHLNHQTNSLIALECIPSGFIDFDFFVELNCPNKLLYISSQVFPNNIENYIKDETFTISFLGGNNHNAENIEVIKKLSKKSKKITNLNGSKRKGSINIEKETNNLAKFDYLLFIDQEVFFLKCPINL